MSNWKQSRASTPLVAYGVQSSRALVSLGLVLLTNFALRSMSRAQATLPKDEADVPSVEEVIEPSVDGADAPIVPDAQPAEDEQPLETPPLSDVSTESTPVAEAAPLVEAAATEITQPTPTVQPDPRKRFAFEIGGGIGLVQLNSERDDTGGVLIVEPIALFGNYGDRVRLDFALGLDGWIGVANSSLFGGFFGWPGLSISTGNDDTAFRTRLHYGAGVVRSTRTYGTFRALRVSVGFRIGRIGTDVIWRQVFGGDDTASFVSANINVRF